MKEHFEKFLGFGNVSDNENDLAAYAYDASEIAGKARLVAFPSQDEQLRLIFSFCNRSSIDVIPRGNGTNTVGMTVPGQSVVVCTQGFGRIHSLNVAERWVRVDCGVTIAELNESLSEHGFRYPLETSSSKLRTVGSLLACNGMSRHSQRYGRAVDTVVELEVMDGTGKFFTVTKDIPDYCGNEGSVFFILRAKLRIIPLKDRSVDVEYFDTIEEAVQRVGELIPERPLSLELLDSAAATYAGFNTKHTLLVEWEGDHGLLKHEQHLLTMRKRDAARRLLGLKGHTLIEDGSVPAEKLAEAFAWCRDHDVPVIAHAGLGVVHPFFKREQESLRRAWYEWAQRAGGSVTGQFGYGLRKKEYVPSELKQKIRRLKERYDYNNVLCRGKLYDYI